MWQSPNSEIAGGFLADNLSTLFMLWGGLSIWDFPKRILDTVGVLGVSLTVAIVPIAIVLRQWKRPLFWMFVLPIIYYATNLAPQTYVYMMPSIAAGAIMAGEGLARMNWQWAWAVAGTMVVMLGINCNYFDVGRTIDPELSARKFWNEELAKVPDEHILLAQQGWEWAMVYPYNRDNGRDIIPICTGTLASKQYQDLLHSWEVKFDVPEDKATLVELQNFIIKSIMDKNDNVWTTFPTKPKTYEAEITPIKYTVTEENEGGWTPYSAGTRLFSNENYDKLISELATPQGITDGSMDMVWQWRPSNPYDIITGAIEVEEWIYIVFSNYTVLTFTMMGTIGMVPVWTGWMVIVRRKKWDVRNVIRHLRTAN